MAPGPVTPKPSEYDRCRAAFETAARGELTAYERAHGLRRYTPAPLTHHQLRDRVAHPVDWQWVVVIVNSEPTLTRDYVRPTEVTAAVSLLKQHAAGEKPTNIIPLAPLPGDLMNCPRCDKWKPSNEFYARKDTRSGKQTYCISCHKELASAGYRRRRAA